jgi:hypothetical protein
MDALLLLRIYNRAVNAATFCVTNAVYIWETLVNAYNVKINLFFEGIAAPYNQAAVNVGAPSSAVPRWYYRDDTKTFVEWTVNFQNMEDTEATLKARSLPILSIGIVSDERLIHDLTDFAETIRVFHSNPETFPSIAHILGAWSLSSRIVLNPADKYFATIITSAAETIAVPIDSMEYFNAVTDTKAEPEAETEPLVQST